jgi:plastocyanin
MDQTTAFRPQWLTTCVGLLLLLVLLAGCSGTTGVVPEQDAEGRYVIHLTGDNRFAPDDARVPAGATVLWTVDAGRHDIAAEDGPFYYTGKGVDEKGYPLLMGPGETYEFTFNETGSWTYWCHTHHEYGMKGRITVE